MRYAGLTKTCERQHNNTIFRIERCKTVTVPSLDNAFGIESFYLFPFHSCVLIETGERFRAICQALTRSYGTHNTSSRAIRL